MNTVSRIENLRYILRTLLAEREEYAGWRVPDALETQQTMMRALLNVRHPQPVSPERYVEGKWMCMYGKTVINGTQVMNAIRTLWERLAMAMLFCWNSA